MRNPFRRSNKRRGGMKPFTAGLVGLIVIVLITYLGFTKFANPFSNPYQIHAIVASANGLRPASLVRIAGVNVGKVTSIKPVSSCQAAPATQCPAADVTMTIDPNGLPIHRDATFAIRPRLFLEGNFFVDLSPGSPSAPDAPTGFTFPIQQGVQPVQFGQVLSALPEDTRTNLQILLQEYGSAVKQSGSSFNASVQYWLPAYKYTSMVAHEALGLEPNDLPKLIDNGGTVVAAVDAHPQNLKNLVTDFNTTALAFARQNVALQNAVAQLPRTLAAAIPAFNALNAVFCTGPQVPKCAPGPLPKLATALIPGVQAIPPLVDKTLPFITQLRLLVAPDELQGLTADLAVTVPELTNLTLQTIPFLSGQVRPASSCLANVIYPWTQLTVPDSHFSASNGFPPRQTYVEALDFLPGIAGESRNFDANGPYIRVSFTQQGNLSYQLAPGVFGLAQIPLQGAQPPLPPTGKRPPLAGGDAPNVACETQPAITDLSAPTITPLRQAHPGP